MFMVPAASINLNDVKPGCETSLRHVEHPVRPYELPFRSGLRRSMACGASKTTALRALAMVLILGALSLQPAAGSDREGPMATLDRQSSSSTGAAPSLINRVADRVDVPSNSLRGSFPAGPQPRVLIRYLASNPDAMRRARDVAKALVADGVEVSDVRDSVAAMRTELRYFYIPDRAAAETVGRLADIKPTRSTFAEDDLMPRPGTIQLTVSGR